MPRWWSETHLATDFVEYSFVVNYIVEFVLSLYNIIYMHICDLICENQPLLRLLAVLLSVFSSQMQALSQGLWVLCAKMGVAWHILGVGEVSEP